CVFVRGLDQEPRFLALEPSRSQAYQGPLAAQPFAVKPEDELAFLESPMGIVDRFPGAAVPQHDRAGAVVARRDHALERAVVDRMILGADGQALDLRTEARAARDSPALQHAVQLQPEVVMQAPGGVLLGHVAPARFAALCALRLRSFRESALGMIGREARQRALSASRLALAGRWSCHHV